MKNSYKISRDTNVSGTWLQGYVGASYTELVLVFGQPTYLSKDGQGKTKAEWNLRIDGVPVTIYDYKEYDKSLDQIYEWHIGGTSKEAAEVVQRVLEARHQPRN